MAWLTLISSTIVLLLPLGVNLVAAEGTLQQWSRMLLAIGAFEALTVILFDLFADTKPRDWAKVKPTTSKISAISN